MKRYRMFINGEFAGSHTGKTFPVFDPSTEETIAEVPDAGEADIDAAVHAARSDRDSGGLAEISAVASRRRPSTWARASGRRSGA